MVRNPVLEVNGIIIQHYNGLYYVSTGGKLLHRSFLFDLAFEYFLEELNFNDWLCSWENKHGWYYPIMDLGEYDG